MGTLTNSAKKNEFIAGIAEIVMDTVRDTDKAVDELYAVANKAKRQVMDKATNFLLQTTGSESGLFSILVATADQAIEMGEVFGKSKTLAPERRAAIKKAVDQAQEARHAASKEYDLVPLSDDSEDNWVAAVQGEATLAIKSLLTARKNYIVAFHDLYTKTKSDETAEIYRKIGKANEEFCNTVAIAFGGIQKELEADGIDIAGMLGDVSETAQSLRGADVNTNGASIREDAVPMNV